VRETEGNRAPVDVGAIEGDQSGEAGRAPPNAPARNSRNVQAWALTLAGVCLIGAGYEDADFEDIRSEKTVVHFTPLTGAEIRDYVATGEPMDKAGAYAIQGRAWRWISKIEGDYFNVVGLPVDLVWRMLREHGVQ